LAAEVGASLGFRPAGSAGPVTEPESPVLTTEPPTSPPDLNRRLLIDGGLLSLVLFSAFESYFAWGWSIPGTAAAVVLTRPWLASGNDGGPCDLELEYGSPPP
jgi:hypothetical protein